LLDLLDAQPLVADGVILFVVQGGDELLALGAIAVGVDSLVGVLTDYIISHHSHNFYFLSFGEVFLSFSVCIISQFILFVNTFFIFLELA
jgi:hypothetical protein